MGLCEDLDQLQAAHHTWSGRGRWARVRGTKGACPAPPQAELMAQGAATAALPAKQGCCRCKAAWSSMLLLLLLSLPWDLLPGGNSRVILEVGMKPCHCLACFWHLAVLPQNMQGCRGGQHTESMAVGVPHLPIAVPPRQPCKRPFLAFPPSQRFHHN